MSTDLLARYDAWVASREALSAQEAAGDYPAPGQWADSDDEGVELAHLLAAALRSRP